MILIILIYLSLFFLIIFSLYRLFNFINKIRIGIPNNKIIVIKEAILPLLLIIFSIVIFLYINSLFSTAFEDHYDVKKGTLLWKQTMNYDVIEDFPVIEKSENVVYNHLSGDNPNFAIAWEINYYTNADTNQVKDVLLKYLKNKGFTISRKAKSELTSWETRYLDNNTTIYYKGNTNTGDYNKDYSISINITTRGNNWSEIYVFICM